MIYCNLYTLQVFQSRGSMNHFPLDSTAQAFPCSYQSQQGLPLQNGMAGNADVTQFSLNQLNSLLRGNPSLQLPPLDGLGDTARQVKIKKKKNSIIRITISFIDNFKPFCAHVWFLRILMHIKALKRCVNLSESS